MSAKPGTRAYAMDQGMRGDQIEEYVRVYDASKRESAMMQTGAEREEAARLDQAREDFAVSSKPNFDSMHEWNTSKAKRRDPTEAKVDSSGFLDFLNPFSLYSR